MATFFLAAFLRVAFLATFFLAAFLRVVFLAAFLRVVFLAAFLRVVFLATFLRAAFLATFFRVAFFFLAMIMAPCSCAVGVSEVSGRRNGAHFLEICTLFGHIWEEP